MGCDSPKPFLTVKNVHLTLSSNALRQLPGALLAGEAGQGRTKSQNLFSQQVYAGPSSQGHHPETLGISFDYLKGILSDGACSSQDRDALPLSLRHISPSQIR
jgi:hypothetical protein